MSCLNLHCKELPSQDRNLKGAAMLTVEGWMDYHAAHVFFQVDHWSKIIFGWISYRSPEESSYRWISGARFIVPLENVDIKVPGE